MSGIMTATVGTVTAVSILYGAGLFNTTTGVDLSPITGSSDNSIARVWVGYILSNTNSFSLSLTAVCSRNSNSFNNGQTIGRLWLGPTAITGATAENTNITVTASRDSGFGSDSQTRTTSANFTLTAGVYYPVRIQWNGDYPSQFSGSLTFLMNGSSDVAGKIFYNTLTNGF
jgi:hypothetical protein